MSRYKKPHLSFEQQLELLKPRGMEVTNDNAALEYLHRLGYYRLSGYWYPSRKLRPLIERQAKNGRSQRTNNFMPKTKFQDIVSLYIFDKKLRLLILDAIERIEVAIRVDIAYLLGEKDPFAYMKPELLHGNFTKKIDPQKGKTKYQDWISKYESLVIKSKEDFVEHYKVKYGLPLPIWVAIELWDFGLLSFFYQGMAVKDKAQIAQRYNIPDWQIMESWLRSLNYVRNVVAHHGRLWNRNLIDQPKLPKSGEMPPFDPFIGNIHITSRIYVMLCISAHFMKNICPKSMWHMRVVELIHSFPKSDHVNIQDMGFPHEWEQQVFWKKYELL